MPTVTITAKAVYAPGDGKKFGAIVDTGDIRYPATALFTGKVQKGQTVTLDYKEESWSGKPVMVVTKVHDQPKPQTNGHAPHAGGNAQGREIFITGIVGRAMGSGQFTVNDIRLLTLAAAEAWDALHAPRPAPQHAPPPQPQDYGDPGYQGNRPSRRASSPNDFYSDPLPI